MKKVLLLSVMLVGATLIAAIPAASASHGPHRCEEIGGVYDYSCVGVVGTCVVAWYDDDPDGDPYDDGSKITQQTCATAVEPILETGGSP